MVRSKTEERLRLALQARNLPAQSNVNIGHYEVDFLIGNHTIIEVDGYHHLSRSGRRRDAIKETHLRRQGYEIFRIPAGHVWVGAERRCFLRRVMRHLGTEDKTEQKPDRRSPPLSEEDREKLRRLRDRLRRAEKERSQGCTDHLKTGETPHELIRRHLDRHFPHKRNNR